MITAGPILVAMGMAAVHSVSIPKGPTLAGLDRLGQQAHIDFVVATDLSTAISPAISGRLTTEAALEKLLKPAHAHATRLGNQVYRIERDAPAKQPGSRPASTVVEPITEVVVVAPVQRGILTDTIGRVKLDSSQLARAKGRLGTDAIADMTADVDSTRLGPGRNKLFVRGIADSGFSGPLQATVSQYLGDIRLTFGSPDPDLALVDIERIDVFEGPQGSRFGSGPIGGVVRVVPTAPDATQSTVSVQSGVSTTRQGSGGADLAIIGNTALGNGRAGRFVLYGRHDGGFSTNGAINDGNRDSIDTIGGRGMVRFITQTWTVDATALVQGTNAGDVQKAWRDIPDVSQATHAEPYKSRFGLLAVVASQRTPVSHVTVSASLTRQHVNERFDGTDIEAYSPRAVDRDQTATAFVTEARAEQNLGSNLSFNGGLTATIGQVDLIKSELNASNGSPTYATKLTRKFSDYAVFGEFSLGVTPHLRVVAGGRASVARSASQQYQLGGFGKEGAESSPDITLHWTPTVSARWRTPLGNDVFVRYEEGARSGGVSLSGTVQTVYQSDALALTELGTRFSLARRLTGKLSVGQVLWRNVQSDTVTFTGDLVTTNVGNGRIAFLQAQASWAASDALHVSGSVVLNDSRLTPTGFSVTNVAPGPIPNVAPVSAQLSIDYGVAFFGDGRLALSADFRYVGSSRLGAGPGLDVPQGGYLKSDLEARWSHEGGAVSLQILNAADVAAARYGIASPYQIYQDRYTPLRPRTIRIGLDHKF